MDFGLISLHTNYSDLEDDINIAAKAGYDAVALNVDKLLAWFEAGFSLSDFSNLLEEYELSVSSIDIAESVDTLSLVKIENLMMKIELLSELEIADLCQNIRLRGSDELDDLSVNDNIRFTACNIRKLCELGNLSGLKFQYEGAAWNPVHSLKHLQMLLEEVGMDNFGVVIDFWTLWVSGGGQPDDIMNFESDCIYSVQITDGIRPSGNIFLPAAADNHRSLPGDGNVPVAAWVDAVKAIGFTGCFSGGYFASDSARRDIPEIAENNLKRMKMYF